MNIDNTLGSCAPSLQRQLVLGMCAISCGMVHVQARSQRACETIKADTRTLSREAGP